MGKQFCKKLPVDSADTLRVKKIFEIALSRSVIEINVFCVWLKSHDIIFRNFSQGYCIHLPNMKRICLMAAKLLQKENADQADLVDPAEWLLLYTNKHPSRDT